MSRRLLPTTPRIATLAAGFVIALTLAPLSTAQEDPRAAAAQSQRIISGRVSNAATGALLEGARIELQGAGRAVFTDVEGRYTILVPRNDATLAVSYTGLETAHISLPASDEAPAIQNVALTADIYRLQPFTVEGDREGSALAATRQRQSANVKNIVATDAFGTMTEDNVGTFLQKIPGIVATDVSGSGVREVMVRGIAAGLNTVEMDGVQLANNNSTGTNRAFDFFQASLTLIESIEVTKAPTPDRPANSIGGSINMVTRSAFNRNAPRQIRYSFGFAHLLGRKGGRAELDIDEPVRTLTPALTLAYSDVWGRNRNLGVSLSYSRNVVFYSSTDTEHYYQATVNRPAYMYRTRLQLQAMGGPHFRENIGGKFEYKLSPRSTFTFNAARNFYLERPHTLQFNLQTTNNANQIRPGYTETRSEIIPSNNAAATMSGSTYDNFTKNYRLLGSGAHRLDGLTLDYTGSLSMSHAFQNYSPGERKFNHGVKTKGNPSVSGLTGIGFIIDRTRDEVFPQVTQTAGRDFYDLNNFTTLTLTQNNRIAKSAIWEGRANARKDFQLVVPGYVKAGAQIQHQERRKDYHYHSYRFTGPGGLGQFANQAGWVNETLEGMRQPQWIDVYYISKHKEENPQQWPEDFAYKHTQREQNQQDFSETISSAYVQTNVKFGPLGVLAGVRFEKTDTAGNGPLQQLTAAERARRTAWGTAPVTDEEGRRRALAEWGQRIHAEGSYQDLFPGVHLTYRAKSGLVGRLSYSTSVGRPAVTSIIPNTTVNDDNQTLSNANTGLKPQFSDNFDCNVEYYFEPIGTLSASVFLKQVKDFIYSRSNIIVPAGPDNGFDGLYEGYRLTTSLNGGSARYRGIEFSYSQQFTFLPGLWRGFGVNANFTYLQTQGDYGGAVATKEVPGFRPRQANAAISYQIRKYRASVQATWVDDYLLSTATNPASVIYESARLVVNLKFTYDVSRTTSVYLNLDNLGRSPINSRYYAGYQDRIGYTRLPFRSIAAGVQGRF